jgi:hypothetical protein
MTQAPPPAPAQGIAAVPVVLAAGVISTVPFPTLPTGGPIPWRTPWVVILNSSPFTLLVTSGGQTTQIAAFTSDKVFVISQGNTMPLTVLPLAGAALPIGGQDTTIYATWYAQEPPGTYPAALGSGAALLAQQTTIVPFTGATLTPGNNSGFGPFSTLGFGGCTINIIETLGNGPLTLQITWADAVNTTVQQRTVIVAAGGSAQFSVPHFGANVAFSIRNNNAAVNVNYNFEVIFTAIALAAWNVPYNTTQNFVQGQLLQFINVVTPGNSSSASSLITYAGPATMYVNLNGAAQWSLQLLTCLQTGAYNNVQTWATGTIPNIGGSVPLTLGASPVRFTVTNPMVGANLTATVTIIADDWRVG